MTKQHQYDRQFYRYINRGALNSARVILPRVRDKLAVASVLDVGCGAGAWLAVWKDLGASVLGLDGGYVKPDSLLIDAGEFRAGDIAPGFDLGRRMDLVQCLEVAEHLPASQAAEFVASLCRHGDVVLFSAAPPGQGGEHHINEQPYAWWRDRFADCGYQMYDPFRQSLLDQKQVMPWYRYNLFLYIRRDALPALHDALAPFWVSPDTEPIDLSPLLYRCRKHLLALLPVAMMTRLAMVKKYLLPRLPGWY